MTVIKVVKDELPFVPVIIKKLLPCMGLNVASLILECFLLSTDNNFTEKFCKCMHSDSTCQCVSTIFSPVIFCHDIILI